MEIPSLQQLLEAGVHFGHQTRRWNPKMAPFLFGKKKGIHIFDLEITQKKLEEAANFLNSVALEGKPIIFICTKKQARDMVREGAINAKAMYVTNRWLGGMLTNFETLQKSLNKYEMIKNGLENNSFSDNTKRERGLILRKKIRLDRIYSGIANLRELPGAIVVIDAKRERTAIREANAVRVPVVAVLDSNSDPTGIDYPIPANDDAYRAVKIIVDVLFDAVTYPQAKIKLTSPKKTSKKTEGEQGLNDLGLSKKTVTALENVGVTSVSGLKNMSESDLVKVKGLGKKAVADIQEIFNEEEI